MANTTLKMIKSNYEKSWSGTTRTINFGPLLCDLCLWIDAPCILCERQKFSESHKLKRFGARNQLRAARFVTVLFIGSSLNAMELVVLNQSVGGPGTTKSRDMTVDWWLLTSSEMSVLHASHVKWPIPGWKWPNPTMKNRGLGPLGPSILDPFYVISDLWPFRLLDLVWMQWN